MDFYPAYIYYIDKLQTEDSHILVSKFSYSKNANIYLLDSRWIYEETRMS